MLSNKLSHKYKSSLVACSTIVIITHICISSGISRHIYMFIECFDLFHHHPTLGVDDVDRHGDLGTLVAAAKRLKAPGMSSPRYHLDIMIV